MILCLLDQQNCCQVLSGCMCDFLEPHVRRDLMLKAMFQCSTSAKGYHWRWQRFAFETWSFTAERVNIWRWIVLYLYVSMNFEESCEHYFARWWSHILFCTFNSTSGDDPFHKYFSNGLKPPDSLVRIAKRQAPWGWIGHACQLLDLFGRRWSSTTAIL